MNRVTARRRSEQLQAATYSIAEAAQASRGLHDLLPAIHRIVGELMPARNLYIALYDEAANWISFPYFVDELDAPPAPKRPGRGLTEYVLRTGRTLLATPEVHAALDGVVRPVWTDRRQDVIALNLREEVFTATLTFP